MATRNKQTRMEALVANQPPQQHGYRAIKPRLPFRPLMTMLDTPAGEWHIDAPLDEIVEKGGLGGNSFDRRQLREDLCFSISMAYVNVGIELRMRKRAEVERRKFVIINDFLKLIDGLENEIDEFEHFLDKNPEIDGQQDFDNLQKFSELGEAIRPLACSYINGTALTNDAIKADATKHDERGFFKAIIEWWLANVTGGWRGEIAVQDRLAAALWLDFGRDIPQVKSKHDGKLIEQRPEDWAKEQFKSLRKS